jgi:hypothetical protein
MTDKIASNHKKITLTGYDVGEGNHFVSYKGFDGYHAYGSIAGKSITIEGKDIKEIEDKLAGILTDAKREYTIKLSTCEFLALTLKEGGLAKLVKEKDSGEKK